jgi:hypothetical protein
MAFTSPNARPFVASTGFAGNHVISLKQFDREAVLCAARLRREAIGEAAGRHHCDCDCTRALTPYLLL